MINRILIVAMPGAGNFGDDLISVGLVEHIFRKYPLGVDVGVLMNEETVPLVYPNPGVTYLKKPQLKQGYKSFIKRKRALKEWLNETDVILIGGGGLFQDSHFPFTIHRYMRYAFMARKAKVFAVGLGVGPIKYTFNKWYLKYTIDRFSFIQVRDQYSHDLLKEFNPCNPIYIAPDIVAGSDLQSISSSSLKGSAYLGCSLRPWKNFSAERVASFISKVCKSEGLSCKLFVFEYAHSNQDEYEFALIIQQVLESHDVKTQIYIYNKTPINVFLDALKSVNKAIAVRFHANIIWQKMGIGVFPLSYAPKVTSLYSDHSVEKDQVTSVDNISDPASVRYHKISFKEHYQLPNLNMYSIKNVRIKHMLLFFAFDLFDSGYRAWALFYKKIYH